MLHVHHDERAAGFVALGLGLATGRPAVVLTTSGTAAAELHPAVVEASQAGVPLIACTADRPPELQDVGAPQTIDQTHLFGGAVRWFAEPGRAATPPVAGAVAVAGRPGRGRGDRRRRRPGRSTSTSPSVTRWSASRVRCPQAGPAASRGTAPRRLARPASGSAAELVPLLAWSAGAA